MRSATRRLARRAQRRARRRGLGAGAAAGQAHLRELVRRRRAARQARHPRRRLVPDRLRDAHGQRRGVRRGVRQPRAADRAARTAARARPPRSPSTPPAGRWSRSPIAPIPPRDDLPRLFGSRAALAQATWRHLLFGIVLGELERRVNSRARGARARARGVLLLQRARLARARALRAPRRLTGARPDEAVRALITGASGFAGGWLCRACSRRATRSTASRARAPRRTARRRLAVDLRDGEAVAACVRRLAPDVVYHVAALSSVGRSWDRARRGRSRPTSAARSALLEAIRLARPRRAHRVGQLERGLRHGPRRGRSPRTGRVAGRRARTRSPSWRPSSSPRCTPARMGCGS